MKWVILLSILGLPSCAKSDVDKCVEAQMADFDNRAPNASKEGRDRRRAYAYQQCKGG